MKFFKRKSVLPPKRPKAPAEEQYEQAIRNVFQTMSGEFLMEWLERECFFWETTDVPGDPIETAKNERVRALLLDIKRIVAEEDMIMATDTQEDDDNDFGRTESDPGGLRVESG